VPVLLGAGTTAYAYWSAAGEGQGQVGVGTALALPVTTGSVSGPLHPGATGNLHFSVANPNTYAVGLTALTAATVVSSHEAVCPGATHLLVAESVSSGGHQISPSPLLVPAKSAATAGSLLGVVTLSADAPDACQGVTFTVTLAFTGYQE
jgi:hypothetical protein